MNTILHLGVGNFHRAHQAWYTHAANLAADATPASDPAAGAVASADAGPSADTAPVATADRPGERWRSVGVSLRSPDVRDALRPDAFAYTLAVADADGETLHRIDVIDDILVATEDPDAVVAAIADPAVAVITLTVTEKGYALGSDGRLALGTPTVVADVEAIGAGRAPTTTIGLLAAGLAGRAARGTPVTVLSCDNLPDNGGKLADAVRDMARLAGLAAAAFSEPAVAFPSSMVDRITPATDGALRERVARMAERAAGRTTGRAEAGDPTVRSTGPLPTASPVATEAFTEWVIEDRFAGPRPRWEVAGAVFAEDVEPYERRKLRMLNGAHSYLAYAGALAGHEFVHEAIADAALRAGAVAIMDEAAATLPAVVRENADGYRDALLERFANPALEHRLRQIAMDGSLKLPIRILGTRAARAAQGLESPACDAALAAWRAFLAGEFAAGRAVDDPAAGRLARGIERGDEALALLGGAS